MNDTPILKKLDRMRRYMEDPKRIVQDPFSIYEDMNGRTLHVIDFKTSAPARACLLGWARFVGGNEHGSELENLMNAASVSLGYVSCTEALLRRRHLDVIDRATEMVTTGERN